MLAGGSLIIKRALLKMPGWLSGILMTIALLMVILPALHAWNQLIDNPAITRQARAEYIAIAKYEALKAERDIALAEQKITQKINTRLNYQMDGYSRAQAEFQKQAKAEQIRNQELNDELQELAKNRRNDVPTLDDLGITHRLRNR